VYSIILKLTVVTVVNKNKITSFIVNHDGKPQRKNSSKDSNTGYCTSDNEPDENENATHNTFAKLTCIFVF
jgi:hypothetical protein